MARLTDLEPRWIGLLNWSAKDRPLHVGLTFLCPHCKIQRLAIHFTPPIDPTNCAAEAGFTADLSGYLLTKNAWNRTAGETFDSLTVSPSVDVSARGHWHGFIENGEIK